MDIDQIAFVATVLLTGIAVGVVFGPKDTVTIYEVTDHDSYQGDE